MRYGMIYSAVISVMPVMNQSSHTAMAACAARAAHLIVDTEPHIFVDSLAEGLLAGRADEFLRYHRSHGYHPVLAGARAQAVVRARVAEDYLAEAIAQGV